jgi:hypothetical protein
MLLRGALGLGVPGLFPARDPETSVASVAPAQSEREAGTLRNQGGRLTSELEWSSRRFPAGDGAPRGIEVQRPRRPADRPPSECQTRCPSYREHVGGASQAVLPGWEGTRVGTSAQGGEVKHNSGGDWATPEHCRHLYPVLLCFLSLN